MTADLEAIRESYDTVAAAYAELLRDALAASPHDRAVLALFAELVLAVGGGPVADLGCGPGRITAQLARLGLDAFGVDLSPRMVAVARRDHPGLRFEVGSLTCLDLICPDLADGALADGALAGALAWYSLIHLPDDVVRDALARFRRTLRPGGLLLLAFQVGDDVRLKTSGYGGHPMRLHVHLRPPERVAGWLADAGLEVRAQLVREPEPPESVPQAYLLARRSP